MDATLKINLNSPQAISFMSYAETLPFVAVEKRNGKTFEEAVKECNGISVDEFFDELDERIKRRFHA